MHLSAHSLTKRYGAAANYEAVRDASLELRAGEFVSIVGRSGSGKSTLLAMLGALTPPTAGKILLDGTDVWALTETERAAFRCRQIGFIFQFPSLLSNLTAVDNVAVPALLGRTMEAETAYARAYDILTRVGLGGRASADPGTMSGGEQRRVVVARAAHQFAACAASR
jgi:ABC-type lipoprotein export system ATPase subunit